MTFTPIPTVNFPATGNTGSIDVSKFSRTGSTYTNPDLFRLMLAQNFKDFDILGGTEEESQDSIFGSSGFFGTSSSTSINGLSSSMPSDISAQTISPSSITPQIQLIALSYLPGKTVTALNPLTNKTITGKVESVLIENGILVVDIAGTKVPSEYLNQVSV